MVAVATQNIIKEAKKKKLGRDSYDANLDPDKEIQNTRRIKKVSKISHWIAWLLALATLASI